MSAAALARLVVGLKLRLLRNGLKRSAWQVVALVLGLLYGAGVTALAVAGLVALRAADAATTGTVTTLFGAALLVGWALVPLVAFGVDATMDPARLALLPLRPRSLVVALLAAGLVGVPGALTAVVALATLVPWTRGVATLLVAAVGALVGLLTCVAASRATTTAAARVLAGRRTREVGAAVGVLLLVLVGPLANVLTSGGVELSLGALQRAAAVVGWTPLGWAWSAPAEAAAGRPLVAAAKLALAAALLAGVMAAWAAVLASALVTPPSAPSAGRRSLRGRSGALARLETGRTGAVAARCLRGWRRDPRYVVSLVAMVALPAVLGGLALAGAMDVGTAALLLGPTVGGVLGWAQHDDVAYDGTAVWMHVSAAVPGRADRWGRALGVLPWGLPVTVGACVAGAAVAGRWDLLPAVLGASLALFGAGLGVSAVASAVAPYRVPEAGANPFATPPGAAVTTVLAQLATSTAAGLLAAPALVAAVLAVVLDDPGATVAGWAALGLGVVVGTGALLAGVHVGGRAFERRGPELLAALQG